MIKSRTYRLLIFLVLLACTSIIIVIILVFKNQPDIIATNNNEIDTAIVQPINTVAYTKITALSQYSIAKAEALAWSADAQLVSAGANWLYVISMEQVGKPARWNYSFYSASKKRLLFVMVEADGQTKQIKHVVNITLPPPSVMVDEWIIDSPIALAIWLDSGGVDLLRYNPGADLIIQLRGINDSSIPVWSVIGLDKRTGNIHTVVFDAKQGKITDITPVVE